jgi:hypothetical protein
MVLRKRGLLTLANAITPSAQLTPINCHKQFRKAEATHNNNKAGRKEKLAEASQEGERVVKVREKEWGGGGMG